MEHFLTREFYSLNRMQWPVVISPSCYEIAGDYLTCAIGHFVTRMLLYSAMV